MASATRGAARAGIGALAALLLLAGVWLHLALSERLDGFLDPDEAVVGLMARHIAHGQDAPAFYYGQPYLGSLEAWLLAPVEALAPGKPAALRLALVVVWLVAAAATFDAARTAGGAAAGLAGLALLALPSAERLLWDLKLRGGFVEGVALAALCLALGGRLLARPASRRLAFAAALAGGLAAWTNQLLLPLVAVLAWAALRAGVSRGRLAAGFVLGSAPLWVYNVIHPLATFRYLVAHWLANAGEVPGHALTLFRATLPQLAAGPFLSLLGGRRNLFWVGTATLVLGVLLLALRRARPLLHQVRAGHVPALGDLALLALLVSLPLRRNAELNQLLHLVPCAAVAFAGAVRGHRGWPGRAWLLPPLMLAALGLAESVLWLRVIHLDGEPVRALVARLDARGVRAIRAEHRPAYLVAYASGERIAASPLLSRGFGRDRWPPYTERVLGDPGAAYVFEVGSANEEDFRRDRPDAPPPDEVAAYHIYLPPIPGGPWPE